VAALARRKNRRHAVSSGKANRANIARLATAQDDELEKARAAKEAAELELEAAKLRQELEAMETETKLRKRKTRAENILAGGSGVSVTPSQLRAELKKEDGVDFSEVEISELIKATSRDQLPDASLGYEELSSELFEREVRSLKEKIQQREMEEMRQAQLRAEKIRQARGESDDGSYDSDAEERARRTDVEENDAGTKILAALAYLLPLAEGLQFALPLLQMAPALSLLFAPIILVNFLLTSIPFGGLILIIIFITAAQNRELPRMLRFNLEQAVLLDIALILPSLLFAGASTTGDANLALSVAVLSFTLLFFVATWCILKILLRDEIPDDIPVISNAAKNFIDQGTFFDPPRR